jgi:poly-gamma-glutamate synthesis protein (capsule biosynthesis protein)
VVSFHWGKEFDCYPGDIQRKMAHVAVENGAGLIIGHHPHVLQRVEEYEGKLIFYSLGNFVFDRQLPKGTDESVIIDITIDGGI